MKCISLHIVIAVLLIAQSLDAQKLIVKRQDTMQSYAAGTHVADVMENGALAATAVAAENESVRYIIEVDAPASSVLRHAMDKTAAGASALRSDVKARIAAVSPEIRTLREFTHVVNGFCIEARRSHLAAVRNLAGVRRVVEDVKVSSLPVASAAAASPVASPLVGVASGKGVKIGIIDTGIDYLHEALGGGFGAAYKVCGGYDFVNNDSDPMDDNGHGTHVAGIIAGDSKTITGMSSGASVYAYKALDAAGQGYMSTVIAALDRAVEDSVKVINLSLGTSAGDPDDILSQAVDRAAASGIVVVVAAGNAGEYGSIGSPGAARGALTVGAVDSKNVPASFSSKGPVQKNFGVKPEITAPGVSILSSKLGGGYVSMSGTSMSAPYVASLAGALIELHPGWTGAQIRDAIIESSQRLPYAVFIVGGGKADPLKAVQLGTVASPSTMSLGFNTNTAPSWTQRETLYIANASAVPQHYALGSEISSAGVSLQFSQSSIDVPPLGRTMITADVIADNAALADNQSVNEGYAGAVTAVSSVDTVRIPFAFFKGTMMRLQFDETPWQVVVHDRKGKSYTYQPKTTSLAAVLPGGTYDIIATFFPSNYVVHEGVRVSGIADVAMNRAEAVHPVVLVPTDESGAALAADLPHEVYSSIEGLIHRTSGVSLIAMSGGAYTSAQSNAPKYVSDVSSAYAFGYTLNVQKDNSVTYTYEAAIDSGVTDSVTIRFRPEEVKRLEVKYDIDSAATRTAFPIVWSYLRQQGTVTGTTYYDGTAEPLRYPFTQTSFYYRRTSPAFPVFHYREAYKY
jgi:hypothetical protein